MPNAETAVKIGEAVLIPVYGEKKISDERPFKATRQGDVWMVELLIVVHLSASAAQRLSGFPRLLERFFQ